MHNSHNTHRKQVLAVAVVGQASASAIVGGKTDDVMSSTPPARNTVNLAGSIQQNNVIDFCGPIRQQSNGLGASSCEPLANSIDDCSS